MSIKYRKMCEQNVQFLYCPTFKQRSEWVQQGPWPLLHHCAHPNHNSEYTIALIA